MVIDTTPSDNVDSPDPKTLFKDDAIGALLDLREVLAAITSGISDVPIRRPADLQRALQIDAKLSWQIFRLATTSNAVSEGPNVPGPGAWRTFIRAARVQSIPEKLIDRAAHAFGAFEGLRAKHAGDRPAFDQMLAAIAADEDSEAITPAVRRQAFRGQCAVWGVRCATRLSTTFVHPGAKGGMVDLAFVKGRIRIERLRYQASPLIVDQASFVQPKSPREDSDVVREAIDPAQRGEGQPCFLTPFCSQPLPQIEESIAEKNRFRVQVRMHGLGAESATTLVFGTASRNVDATPEPGNEYHIIGVAPESPAEVLIFDVLVHQDLLSTRKPTAKVFGSSEGRIPRPLREEYRLPMNVHVDEIGAGARAIHTPDVPFYPDMMRYVCDQLSWNESEFVVFRCRVQYPIVTASVVMFVDHK